MGSSSISPSATITPDDLDLQVEYDLDEEDEEWLEGYNEKVGGQRCLGWCNPCVAGRQKGGSTGHSSRESATVSHLSQRDGLVDWVGAVR